MKNKEQNLVKKCMNQEEKMKYLYEINSKYNYPEKYIKFYENSEYKICDGSELKKIKMFEQEQIDSLMDLMKKTVDFLDAYGIVYWLDSGTLLGACRDGKFVPWDDDVDLAIPYDSYIKLKQIIRNFPKEYDKETNVKYRIDSKFKIKFTELQSFMTLDKTKPFLLKTLHLDGKLNSDLFIDLMCYFSIDNQNYISNSTVWEKVYVYPFDSIYPLKQIEFEGHQYNCVREPEVFLNNAYWFWKDLAVASHAHFKYMRAHRDKKIYFTLK